MRKTSDKMLAGILMLATVGLVQAQPKNALTSNDYTEIQMLYARYNYAFDSNNPEMWSGTFATDGEFVIGERVLKGRKQLSAFVTPRGPVKERPKILHISTSLSSPHLRARQVRPT